MKKINVRNIFLALGILGFSVAFVFAGELVEKGKGYTIYAKTNLDANSLVILSKITDTKLETTSSSPCASSTMRTLLSLLSSSLFILINVNI